MLGQRGQIAHHHRHRPVAGERDHLPVRVGGLSPDRVRQRSHHRAHRAAEREQLTAAELGPSCPRRNRARIATQDRPVSQSLAEVVGDRIRFDRVAGDRLGALLL